VLAAEVNDLQVPTNPGVDWKDPLQVSLSLDDVLTIRKPPARSQAVDVRIDRERGMTEGLTHHYGCGLVPHARKRLERIDVVGHLPAMSFDQELGHSLEVPGLGRRKSDRANESEDAIDRQHRHGFGIGSLGEQSGRDLVDLLVGRLRAQHHRHEERVRILVHEWDGRLWVERIEDLADAVGLVPAIHGLRTIALARSG
jgi:hypothetical protein